MTTETREKANEQDAPQTAKAGFVGFSLIFAGLVFFFNPYFAVIDVLPDFLGALLVALGLTRLAAISRDLREARAAFFKLAAADAVKAAGVIVIFALGTAAERPAWLLTAAFSAAVVELFFLIPAMRALFGGLLPPAMECECLPLYETGRGGLSRCERMERLSVAFVIARETLCCLPEFTALTASSYSDKWYNLYNYIGVLRAGGCILAGAAGIAWLIAVSVFFAKITKATDFRAALYGRCRAYIAAHPGTAVLARFAVAFALMGAGAFLLADLYIDLHNVLPDLVGALLIAAGAAILALPLKAKLPALLATLAFGAAAAVSTREYGVFTQNHDPSHIVQGGETAAAYRALWLSALAEFVLFMTATVLILLLLRRLVATWGGYRPERPDEGFEARARQKFREEFDGQFITVGIFAFVSGLASFIYDYMQTPPAPGLLYFFEFFWFADFAAGAAFAVAFVVLLGRVFAAVRERFSFY